MRRTGREKESRRFEIQKTGVCAPGGQREIHEDRTAKHREGRELLLVNLPRATRNYT